MGWVTPRWSTRSLTQSHRQQSSLMSFWRVGSELTLANLAMSGPSVSVFISMDIYVSRRRESREVRSSHLQIVERRNSELGTRNALPVGRLLQVPVSYGLEEVAETQE